jgi:hypothetical protein
VPGQEGWQGGLLHGLLEGVQARSLPGRWHTQHPRVDGGVWLGQGVSAANFFWHPNPNPNQLLPMSFSSAALFEPTAANNFQGRNGQRGSAANFFLALEHQFKKEAALAHGVLGPSRSHPLLGASSPTTKDFQGKTGKRGSAADCFLAQERQYKKEAAIAHGVHGPGRSNHLLGASLPTSKDFQGKTGQHGSTDYVLFFLGPGMPAQKRGQYRPWHPWASRSYHLARASLPTPEGLTSQDANAGQDASAAGFAGPPYDCELDEEPTAEDRPKDTVHAANRPWPPSKTKH